MSAEAGWISFHLHYHEDLDRLLIGLVEPLVGDLIAARRIDQSFFIRYALGGRHVRLRLHPEEGQGDAVRAEVTAAAQTFLRTTPSTMSMSAEEIRRVNQSILAADPGERDEEIVPDNCVRERPFQPETDRYGGAALWPSSLDHFARSSARALRFLAVHGAAPRAKQLPLILRMILGEAVGFAADGEELLAILAAPFEGREGALKPLVDRGDQLFAQQRDPLSRLLAADIAAILGGATPAALADLDLSAAARDLAAAVRPAGRAVRRRVAVSQVHMSANRLGIHNAEEVYLGRALWRVVGEIRARDAFLWDRLGEAAGRGA